MATNTKNFNFKKPDESDFYSIQDQNGNWDLADEELQKLNEPAFEDYTTGTSVPPAATALEALKSKIKLPVWMSNVVAFCKGCCTLAMIVNNCVSSDADKPLAAAQGKALQDQLTKLYSDLNPSTMITGGVIDYAESLPICFRTISVNERTSQTPNALNYGTGYIEKSGETDIVIILHNVVTKETYTKRKSNIGWADWETYALKSDFKVLKKTDVQFSDGFAEISFPGLTHDSAVCINQEYKSSAGVQNLVFTGQVRPNELIIYARNANDGSSYNGIIHIMAIAIG